MRGGCLGYAGADDAINLAMLYRLSLTGAGYMPKAASWPSPMRWRWARGRPANVPADRWPMSCAVCVLQEPALRTLALHHAYDSHKAPGIAADALRRLTPPSSSRLAWKPMTSRQHIQVTQAFEDSVLILSEHARADMPDIFSRCFQSGVQHNVGAAGSACCYVPRTPLLLRRALTALALRRARQLIQPARLRMRRRCSITEH